MNKNKIILLGIIAFAFFLRIWGLNKVPPELFGDELDVGYHAYSLLKTGRDYYGQFMPTYIHSFSEWRAPLLMYVTAPFIAVFGLNEWGVRLPSAVFGVMGVFFIYLLASKTFKNVKLGLTSALFLAVSPWHLHYSRAAFEVSLLMTIIIAAVLLFLGSFKKPYKLVMSSVFFALTFYIYSTANVFTPILFVSLILIYKNKLGEISKNYKIISSVVFIFLSLPILYSIVFGKAAERFSAFSVFNDEIIISQINSERIEGGIGFVETFSHNKVVNFGRKILANYTSAFSTRFLFAEGDITFRHSIHLGEMYWITLPLLLAGIYRLVKDGGREKYLWFLWLLIAPIPASLTRDGAFHATRLFMMIPPLTVISALGFQSLDKEKLSKFLKKGVFLIFIFGFLVESFLYTHQYWVHYPRQSWRWWHVGYREALTFMKDRESNYDILVFNNTYEPSLIRFLFWWQYPPDKFLSQFSLDKEIENILPGFNGFSLTDRYYFGTAKDSPGGVIEFVKPRMLYLVSHRDEVGGDWDWELNSPGNIKVLKTIRNQYNQPIFYIVTKG